MSRARHHTMKHKLGGKAKGRATGGETETGNPSVFAEAKGSTIGTIKGDGSPARMDRKRGGSCKASGGKTGSDTSPYTDGKSGAAAHPYTSAHKNGGKAKMDGSHHEGLHGAHRGREGD
jgi:hypothetical protein